MNSKNAIVAILLSMLLLSLTASVIGADEQMPGTVTVGAGDNVEIVMIDSSFTGNQDNSTVWIQIRYEDNATMENVSMQLMINDIRIERVAVDSDNKLTWNNLNLPDNTTNIEIRMENIDDNRADNTTVLPSDNLLFTENTTASFTIDDDAFTVYLDDSGTFTGTITSNATYINLDITAYLKLGGSELDSENYTDNENWSLTTTPTSSTVYAVEMYENSTLMWATVCTIYVSTAGPGGGYVYVPPVSVYVSFKVFENNEPIVGALIEATKQLEQYKIGEKYEVLASGYTNIEGELELEISKGTWAFLISKEKYQTYVIEDKEVYEPVDFNIFLTPFVPEKIKSEDAILGIVIGFSVIGIVAMSAYITLTKRVAPVRKKEEEKEKEG